jgi:hypothetical protein
MKPLQTLVETHVKHSNVKYVFLTGTLKNPAFSPFPRGAARQARNEGSIPFTRSIENQSLTMQCSKSAVKLACFPSSFRNFAFHDANTFISIH